MKKILIVSGHPDLNDSFANKTILEEIHKLLPEAEIAYLDKLYPDFRIDVPKEQERLLHADIIVLQYPLCTFPVTPLDRTDLYPRIFTWQIRRQAERETTGSILHFRRTRRNVQLRRSTTAPYR